MAKGSDVQPTQTTTQVLSPEQQELMKLAMPGVKQFSANVPERYQGNTVAGFDPSQTSGQEMALTAATKQASLADSAAQSMPFFFGNLTDPDSNSVLRSAIDASVRPIQENLMQQTLPGIRGEFGMGNFGASRQGIAEGIASGQASQAIGDTASKLAQNTYDTNINAMLKAYGLLPTVQAAQVTPAATTSAVGDVRQGREQALINQDVGAFNYDQYAPFLQSKEIMSLLTGMPGGSIVSTANNPPKAPLGMQALGGAASGAALGSMLFPGIGTGIGAAGGALLPFLFQ